MTIGCSSRNVYANSVLDQVEPTRSPWPRLFRPSMSSMLEDVDALVKLRTSVMRAIVKGRHPRMRDDDENPNCSRCARDRYVARARGPEPVRTGGGSQRRCGGGGMY